MGRAFLLCCVAVLGALALSIGAPATAQDAATSVPPDRKTRTQEGDANAEAHTPKPVKDENEPTHFRGVITGVDKGAIVVKLKDAKTVRFTLSEHLTVITLDKGSFTGVDFGVYVGAVAVRLEEYSPIVRDSLSWLHRGFELRLIDEELRGIALGHKKWDLTPDAIIAHGWVDDIEGRVLSIKWGPTEIEETDVETPRDAPVLKMGLGDRTMIKPDVHTFIGAMPGADGNYTAVFVVVGKNGIVPPL